MENLYLNATKQTPQIQFNCNGMLSLIGRTLPEDVNSVYNPLLEWTKNLKVEVVNFHIDLEYINSASSKKLIELLKLIDKNDKIKKFIINWNYEEGDDDCRETGEIYEEVLKKAEFTYTEYADATL